MGPRIGIDIITLRRMRDAVDVTGTLFLDKVFTRGEQAGASDAPDRIAYFATRFAAKEAVFKALSDPRGFEYTDIEIEDGPHGEPVARLHGRLAERVGHVAVSVGYDGASALAVAFLSGDPRTGRTTKRDTGTDVRPTPRHPPRANNRRMGGRPVRRARSPDDHRRSEHR